MPHYTSNTQVDNAGVDVRLTQLRNLLAGTRPAAQPTTSDPGWPIRTGTTNGDNNFVLGAGPAPGAGNSTSCPTASRNPNDVSSVGTNPPQVQRTTPAVAGPLGRGSVGSPAQPVPRRGRPGPELGGRTLIIIQSGRATPSASPTCSTARPRRSRRQLQPVRPLSDRSHRRGQRPRLLRLRRWSDAARRPDAPVRHAGRHRRIGPGAALGRPLARGRCRGRRRRGRCVRAGRLRRLFPPPGARGSSASHPTAGWHPARSSIPRPTTSSTPAAPTRPI